MGIGYGYICNNCKHEFSISFGGGFLINEVYHETLNELEQGKYGAEWKNLIISNPDLIVDVELGLYECSQCGNWKNEKRLDLYEIIYPEEERGEPSHFAIETHENYYLSHKYIHKCPACEIPMIQVEDTMAPNKLKCPKCRKLAEQDVFYRWD